MGNGIPERPDRVESILGGVLALVLLAGVLWSLAAGGTTPLVDAAALHLGRWFG